MLEYVIVGLIVAAATLYVLKKYLPQTLRARLFGKAPVQDAGCGSGCGSCGSRCDTPATPGKAQFITLHSR